jgi:hypothetical protein
MRPEIGWPFMLAGILLAGAVAAHGTLRVDPKDALGSTTAASSPRHQAMVLVVRRTWPRRGRSNSNRVEQMRKPGIVP